jgi:hypothetical protein
MALAKEDKLANSSICSMPCTNCVKTLYFSQKGELPIVIDSGTSFPVTPNINNLVGPIRPSSTSDFNGLNATITVISEGGVYGESKMCLTQ